jgi:cytochrome c553
MEKTKMLRLSPVVLAVFLGGCACPALSKHPAAATPSQTAETVYHTCDGCHGPKNLRVEGMSPKIIGQKKAYLAERLRDFRDLKRINPYMNGVVSKMTDQDLDNLAAYYAGYDELDKN